MKVSIVIPALNEEAGIGKVIKSVPVKQLKRMKYDVEIIVVDNGSIDRTAEIARKGGARVVLQPVRGYGHAYKAGFAKATGDIIATSDADMTYPLDALPEMLLMMKKKGIEFVNTDRLTTLNPAAMSKSHVFGNWVLSLITRTLFAWPFKDSQSGMWVFKRSILKHMDVRSGGMPFSQELKVEAYLKGFKCAEMPIEYRIRTGKVKLNALVDGMDNVTQLFMKRLTARKRKGAMVRATG